MLHVDFWSQNIPPNMWRSLKRGVDENMVVHARLKNAKGKNDQTKDTYYQVLRKYNMLHFVRKLSSKINKSANMKQLSYRKMNARVNSMCQLLISHNAAVGVAYNFTHKFLKRAMREDDNVTNLMVQLTQPLIIRDINTLLKNWQRDPYRQRKEALSNEADGVSQRQAQNRRKAVCSCFTTHM
jgi:hypothetical protein